jgi:hypothetical protein
MTQKLILLLLGLFFEKRKMSLEKDSYLEYLRKIWNENFKKNPELLKLLYFYFLIRNLL